MMNKLIELKNLTKNFDDQQVLRGINLDIYEKEFLTLLGPCLLYTSLHSSRVMPPVWRNLTEHLFMRDRIRQRPFIRSGEHCSIITEARW